MGVLDGRGHTITGISIDTAGNAAGLFARLDGARVSNLVIADAQIRIGRDMPGSEATAGILAGKTEGGDVAAKAEGGEITAGTLAGMAAGSKISNVTVTNGSITAHSPGIIGGVVGIAIDTSFDNTGIDGGAITGTDIAGGIAGRIEGTGILYACHSHADITGKIAGGFAGQMQGKPLTANANHALEIDDCTATGKVASLENGVAGGFVGIGEYVIITDSSAHGSVSGVAGAGGFVGRLSGMSRVLYAYAKGDVTLMAGNSNAKNRTSPEFGIANAKYTASPESGIANAKYTASPGSDIASGFAGGFIGELTSSACVEFSYSAGMVVAANGCENTAVGGFVGVISAQGAPNTITHSLSFAPWVTGDGYVHRFAGRTEHDGINGCYAHLGSMVVRGGSIVHVLPNAYGADGADMSMAQIEGVTARLGWRRGVSEPLLK